MAAGFSRTRIRISSSVREKKKSTGGSPAQDTLLRNRKNDHPPFADDRSLAAFKGCSATSAAERPFRGRVDYPAGHPAIPHGSV